MMIFSSSKLATDQPQPPPCRRILIVEDDPEYARLLELYLELQPDLIPVGRVSTVAEAAASARDARPDLVITDYRLPDGDGATVTALVRRQAPRTVVVMLTGDRSPQCRQRALAVGVDAFLQKGEPLSTVLITIRRLPCRPAA